MTTLSYFIILIALGIGGLVVLVGRYVPSLRTLNTQRQRKALEKLPPFFDFIEKYILRPLVEFTGSVVQPASLKLLEKALRRFRIVVLRVEKMLHRLSDYFRGRRIAIKNGNGNKGKNSEFWSEVNKFKDELHSIEKPAPQKKSQRKRS